MIWKLHRSNPDNSLSDKMAPGPAFVIFSVRQNSPTDINVRVVACSVGLNHLYFVFAKRVFPCICMIFGLSWCFAPQNLPDMDGGGNKSDPYVKVGPIIWEYTLRWSFFSHIRQLYLSYSFRSVVYEMIIFGKLLPGDSDGQQAEDEGVRPGKEPHLWRGFKYFPILCE